MRALNRRRSTRSIDQHRDWLELVDTDGPFLAAPALVGTWSQGMPPMDSSRRDSLTDARERFEAEWDAWRKAASGDASIVGSYRSARDAWVDVVLSDIAAWREGYSSISEGDELWSALEVTSPGGITVAHPSAVLSVRGIIGALVYLVDPLVDATLSAVRDDGWASSALDRMQLMLRRPASPCSIGIVSDGRWWAIVSAPSAGSSAWGMFDSQTWGEETRARDAFFELISPRRLVTGMEEGRLPALFAESITAAEEVTDALGKQVRRAVELLVSSFSEAAADVMASGGEDPLPVEGREVYEAAVISMMRVVFLLFAQERGLLPQGRLFEESYGMVGVLDDLERRFEDEGAESLDGTYLAWHRLLATSNAVYTGVSFEDMRMPAYGGSVFDPVRHPFLTETAQDGELLVAVSDRVMLEVLRSVQYAHVSGDARRVSFRELDVEQIGYIYEGLLGYSCQRADEVVLGLMGSEGSEPEVPLAVLESLSSSCNSSSELAASIVEWVKKNRPASKLPTKAKLKSMLSARLSPEADRFLRAVTRDETMRARLLPWTKIIRPDLRGRPTVFLPGSRYVTETSSRKNAGAHYTPRSLAEEVVRYALEPLVFSPGPHQTSSRKRWRRKSSDEILELRVADIACGSGAFLVAAARFLASELVEAWYEEGAIPAVTEEYCLQAMREVVARCLYGVDINEMAVEMCKLSLWLVSLDRRRPFSFVDNKVFVGNSLIGLTSIDQLAARRVDGRFAQTVRLWTEAGDGRIAYASLEVENAIDRAITIRRNLAQPIDEGDPMRNAATKRAQMRRLRTELSSVREIADAVVASALLEGAKPGRKLEGRYSELEDAIVLAYQKNGAGDPVALRAIIKEGLTPTVETDYERWECLHWPLDMPEVIVDHGGFDAIIGNPPFLGGQKITGAMGTNVRDWCVNTIAGGVSGSADLCAYFFLRAFSLLNEHGSMGLLATNTIAQGVTREVGLQQMVDGGFTIVKAYRSRPWPVKTANLEYASIWGTKELLRKDLEKYCDGISCFGISPLLEPEGKVGGNPIKLRENLGIAFQGCNILGDGFIVTQDKADEWIAADEANRDVLFPLLNGKELNSTPDCSSNRWVIDFNDRSLEEASKYSLPYEHVLLYVKPERDKNKRKQRRDYWWKFAERAPKMREAIAPLTEVLAITLTSKTVMPARVSREQVFSHALGIFATDSYSMQAILSSSFHQLWAIRQGSGMRKDPRYTPSDVFETFPRPLETEDLERLGRELNGNRLEVMLRRELGLTDLYNLVNNPDYSTGFDADVDHIRDIHRQIDEAVMAAYGWDDVELNHGFYTYRGMTRWSVCDEAREEILDRLLEENHRRAGVLDG